MQRAVGFTLIELLIVIAIIGILGATLIPNLLAARARAHDAAALSCAKEILTQAEVFVVDNQTYVGFTASGAYEARQCTGGTVAGFTVNTTTDTDVAGSITSIRGSVFRFSNSTAVVRE